MSTRGAPDVLVFDVDGVLVEVTESYREAIRETVKLFTGETVSHDLIQDFKNKGGWNNDWLLTHRLLQDRGIAVEYQAVVEVFNRIFLGENGDGLIRLEKWLPATGLLETLGEQAALAIFTGRVRYELEPTLARFASSIVFDPQITEDVVGVPKPAPDGLFKIQQRYPGKALWYLGDTVDDADSARAAQVPFIGVSTLHNPRHEEIAQTLRERGAFTVLSDINELAGLVQRARTGERFSV